MVDCHCYQQIVASYSTKQQQQQQQQQGAEGCTAAAGGAALSARSASGLATAKQRGRAGRNRV
jgi:hypothetical protein